MIQAAMTALKKTKRMGKYPHHYLTAGGLTIAAVCFGEAKLTVVAFFWLYAIIENCVDDTDEKVRQAVDWLLGIKATNESE